MRSFEILRLPWTLDKTLIHFDLWKHGHGFSVFLSFCLFVIPSISLSVFLFFCVSIFLSFFLSVFLSFCLSVFLSFRRSVFLPFCLSVLARHRSSLVHLSNVLSGIFTGLILLIGLLMVWSYTQPAEVEFVHAVTAGGSVKFLPAV